MAAKGERTTMSNAEAEALALGALGWICADDRRAERLLALTGLTPDALRAGLADEAQVGAMLGAVLGYLTGYEPDLIAAAEALGVMPQVVVAAATRLGAEPPA